MNTKIKIKNHCGLWEAHRLRVCVGCVVESPIWHYPVVKELSWKWSSQFMTVIGSWAARRLQLLILVEDGGGGGGVGGPVGHFMAVFRSTLVIKG